jgi:hypothetical protein
VSAPALVGCTLYVEVLGAEVPPHGSQVHARGIAAIDLAAGVVRWRSEDVFVFADDVEPTENAFPIAVDADTVYGCFQDGALRAYDRATGAPIFSYGMNFGCESAVLDPGPDGARSIVVRRHDGQAMLLERRAPLWPAERAHVIGTLLDTAGRPRPHAPVLVAGALAMTDARGAFDAVVTARGAFAVHANDGHAAAGNAVVLDGRRGPYRVDLREALPGPVE